MMSRRDELLSRIVKGAHYIEKVGKNHPTYHAAMKKYDRLCEEFDQLEGRGGHALSDVPSSN